MRLRKVKIKKLIIVKENLENMIELLINIKTINLSKKETNLFGLRFIGTFPVRMSIISFWGKQGLFELFGANSTVRNNVPETVNHSLVNKNFYRISRITFKNSFNYKGKVDRKECVFKIDTGSNVSILNKKLRAYAANS